MFVRKALLQDASNVYDLVNSLSTDGTLLKRPFAEICENIRDFTVAESDGGVFLGCGALHFYGPHLCEVRSIVVKPEAKGQGAGGRILGPSSAPARKRRCSSASPANSLRNFNGQEKLGAPPISRRLRNGWDTRDSMLNSFRFNPSSQASPPQLQPAHNSAHHPLG